MSAALLDHLWQSSLFAVTIALLMPLFRRQSAALRFWLWFAASMKFLLPFSLLVALGRLALPHVTSVIAAPVLSVIRPASVSFARAAPLMMPAPAQIPAAELGVIVWAVGLIAIGLICLARWLELRAALRDARPVALTAPLPVKAAASFLEPGLVGIWRPVILLPQGLPQQLSPAEMDAILAHELCHLRRRDNLLAALHMLVEGLFWFNPLVWWIGRRLVEERERACDEAVIAAGIRPLVYAEGILKTCRFYVQSPLACASGVSGADLKLRLGAIMAQRPVMELHPAQGLLLMLASTAVVMLPLSAGMMGSAPVSAIALRAATVLAAPRLMAPVLLPAVEVPKPAAVHRVRHIRITARTQEPAAPAAPPVSWIGVRAPALHVDIALDINLPAFAATPDDPMVCRKPQQLAGSHLPGPTVCLHQSKWDLLKTKNEDITPDGTALYRTDYAAQADHGMCPSTFSPGATGGFAFTPPSGNCH